MPGNNVPGRRIRYTADIDNEFFGDISQDKKPYQPFILDLVTTERLFFQTIPQQVEYTMDSEFAVIASPGRNNPNYHYTGSEDTLEFTMVFYCNHESRQDVIKKAKWLESLSKNNGYDEKPHELILSFGDLFKRAKWIMKSAGPQRFSNFNREFKMLPTLVSVNITLARIMGANRLRSEILKYDT